MVADLIDQATASGVVLSIEGGKLCGRPADKLAPFAAELKRHRSDVVAFLTRPAIDPEQWAEPFPAWQGARCVPSPRFSTTVRALYRDFAAWSESRHDWPCDRQAFATLLQRAGLSLIRVCGETFVERLGLVDDVEFARRAYSRKPHS